MKRTLYPKFIICYLIFAISSVVLLCTFTQYATTSYFEKKEAQNLYRETAILSGDYAANFFHSDISLEDFQRYIGAVSRYMSVDIWVMDSSGHVLIDSDDPLVGIHASDFRYDKTIDGFDIADFGNNYYMITDFYGTFSEDTLTVFSPITIGYKVRGYVLFHKSLSEITKNVNGLMTINFYTVIFVIALALILIGGFEIFVYHPIRKIQKATKVYAKGDFSKQISNTSNDEIGDIANTMNYMALELDTLEEDQRKFVSNVSHDFRSPLTSIKGYIEAILDGTIPVEMQDKYLNIILFETERLNKLTKSLLDLNNVGHRGMRLEMADFDINGMIKTTIQTFEGTCTKKGLSFDLVLTGQDLFVKADMTKIQQVLYNLIDNATKFSNKDSAIKIETNIHNEKVFISVKDSGIGIPSESLSKIWERFYKTDQSRGKDKRGTGLGLAIVKEIITAHNENINVISTEGVGTEFIFSLPISSKEHER